MRIIGWTAWHDPRFPDEHNDPLFGERRAEVVEELKRRDYHFTGYYHQEGECGVPIFDDGGALRVSFRSWGQIMADAWPEEKCPEHNAYIRWAWWYEPLTEEQFREQYH